MEWISVEDRLPEAGERVLIALDTGEIDVDSRLETEGWRNWIAMYVTHWMPLPPPPGEQETD